MVGIPIASVMVGYGWLAYLILASTYASFLRYTYAFTSLPCLPDEDISPSDTQNPPVAMQGPMTRARARQLRHQGLWR